MTTNQHTINFFHRTPLGWKTESEGRELLEQIGIDMNYAEYRGFGEWGVQCDDDHLTMIVLVGGYIGKV